MKEKKDNIPRQQKGNQVYQSFLWAPITYPLGNADFWNDTETFVFTLMIQGEKEEKNSPILPTSLLNYLKNRSALLLQGC